MIREIKNRIIRRLGGVPIWYVGRDLIPEWFLQPVENRIEQDSSGVYVTVKYLAIGPGEEYGRRKKK